MPQQHCTTRYGLVLLNWLILDRRAAQAAVAAAGQPLYTGMLVYKAFTN